VKEIRMRRPILTLAAVILASLAAGYALAANRSATLVPPADYTAGGWTVTLTGNATPGSTSSQWCATTHACAHDAGGIDDCASHTVCTASPPTDITTFVNNRLAAWRANRGY
jgi:hypothetical protein